MNKFTSIHWIKSGATISSHCWSLNSLHVTHKERVNRIPKHANKNHNGIPWISMNLQCYIQWMDYGIRKEQFPHCWTEPAYHTEAKGNRIPTKREEYVTAFFNVNSAVIHSIKSETPHCTNWTIIFTWSFWFSFLTGHKYNNNNNTWIWIHHYSLNKNHKQYYHCWAGLYMLQEAIPSSFPTAQRSDYVSEPKLLFKNVLLCRLHPRSV